MEGVGGESMMDGEKDRDRRKGIKRSSSKQMLKKGRVGKEDKRRRGTSGQRKDTDG